LRILQKPGKFDSNRVIDLLPWQRFARQQYDDEGLE
jgi:hypothetical protein